MKRSLWVSAAFSLALTSSFAAQAGMFYEFKVPRNIPSYIPPKQAPVSQGHAAWLRMQESVAIAESYYPMNGMRATFLSAPSKELQALMISRLHEPGSVIHQARIKADGSVKESSFAVPEASRYGTLHDPSNFGVTLRQAVLKDDHDLVISRTFDTIGNSNPAISSSGFRMTLEQKFIQEHKEQVPATLQRVSVLRDGTTQQAQALDAFVMTPSGSSLQTIKFSDLQGTPLHWDLQNLTGGTAERSQVSMSVYTLRNGQVFEDKITWTQTKANQPNGDRTGPAKIELGRVALSEQLLSSRGLLADHVEYAATGATNTRGLKVNLGN